MILKSHRRNHRRTRKVFFFSWAELLNPTRIQCTQKPCKFQDGALLVLFQPTSFFAPSNKKITNASKILPESLLQIINKYCRKQYFYEKNTTNNGLILFFILKNFYHSAKVEKCNCKNTKIKKLKLCQVLLGK